MKNEFAVIGNHYRLKDRKLLTMYLRTCLIITYFKISDPNKDDDESLTMSGEDMKIEDFFCMSCFHKSYTKWKIQNGIN